MILHRFSRNIKNDTLKIYNKKKKNHNYQHLINLIKGLFSIFINNFEHMEALKIESIYNSTKGKIDNYLYLNYDSKYDLYLIRSKFLKDLVDNGKKFNSFSSILKEIKKINSIPRLNYIPISLCPNNNFTPLAYVAMSSILSSKSDNSYICFYLVIPSDFTQKNINFLDSLHELYNYFNITFIIMDNRYDKAYSDQRISKHAYYRFSLGELIPNLNKIIYLDTDVIVYKDLYNFFNLNFNGKIILAQYAMGRKKVNTGILLLNLLELRKKKFEKQVLKIIKKGEKLKLHDQSLLNNNFNKFLGIFPPEFHTRPLGNYREIATFNKKIGNIYDKDYLYFMYKYPTIRHFLDDFKPRNYYINYIEDWWFFARKSKYFNKQINTFETAFSFRE